MIDADRLAGLSVDAAAARLATTGRTRVDAPLSEATSAALRDALTSVDVAWNRAIHTPYDTDVPVAVFEAQDAAEQARLIGMVHEEAVEGFQFLFDRVDLGGTRKPGLPPPSPLDAVHGAFNQPAWLDFARRLTGDDRIAYIDAQATRYLPGHFLNCHDDAKEAAGRLYAYVLNLSPRWRADWGGLLAFTGPDGGIDEAFVPSFGTLNVFRVPQPHLVTQVADFAPEPRLSITGWWRTNPPRTA